ncbi:xanthine dehydrogenase family protein molybdopterin-binding subunit [Mycolicibacterium moriokaense]|nr:xanthine dehydrogenase family protein molybdopterin-binding subunit [Mycolicibacterium moriokaense]
MPVNRVEGQEKVTGAALYTADRGVPGVVHAVLVSAEVARGEIDVESITESAARAGAAPGVLHVLTPLNCPQIGPPPPDFSDVWPVERRPPLSDLMVHYVGQHVAVVVADTFENATYAASLFQLTYRRREPALRAEAVSDLDADDQNTAVRHGCYRPDHWVEVVDEKLQDQRGDRDEPPSVTTVSASYTTAVNAPYPMELSAVIADWIGGQLTVYDSTRWITGEQRFLASCLGLPESSVRVISPLVGGAFGSKVFLWMHVLLCAVAARVVGRPVKMVLTRDQMVSGTGYRPPTTQDVTLLAEATGLITGTEHHTLSETSPVADFCEPAGLSSRFLYHSPRLAVSHRVARMNVPSPCFMRGPGEAPGLFALEVAMDEMAEALGLDPLEVRIRNHADLDQPTGKPWSGKHLLDCYRSAAERFGWAQRPLAARSLRRNGVQIGWGMATATFPGRRAPAGCRVTTDADGRVRFASATHEIGTGVRTVMAQLAADITGLPLSAVIFESGDSTLPETPRSGASQTTATVGSAVAAAASEWRHRLSTLKGTGAVTEQELTELSVEERAALTFSVEGAMGVDRSAIRSFGAHFCEVEVDEQIGRASVTRWVATFDCGRVLNPKLARSQVMGGITFGVGMALLERVVYDDPTAQPIGEYYVPTHVDRPDFDIEFIEVPDYELTTFGVRGIGEIGICGAPAAIANAIHHATGKRLRSLPITLENLMMPYEGPLP